MTVQTRGRGLALLGPAFVASIAYVDPGNVATDGQAGAQFGYLLVWVVVAANLSAAVVQYLSAKLGIVTGRSLTELLGERLRPAARLAFWAQAELVALATDLAEVMGGAIALGILFRLPLPLGGVITAVVSTALLSVRNRWSQRSFERVITVLLAVIAVGFVAGLVVRPPAVGPVLNGLVPRLDGSDSLLLAVGILGSTIMPHVIYLHSALARDRFGPVRDPGSLLVATRYDVGVAMGFAGSVNLVMLLVAATALSGQPGTDSILGVHGAVQGSLGNQVATLFAIGLLASGIASSAVGGYAGAIVMDGLLNYRVPILARRALTALPAVALLACGVDPDRALLWSQVVLSFGIPFALAPLIVLAARKRLMGRWANRVGLTALASAIAAIVIGLNLTLIWSTVTN